MTNFADMASAMKQRGGAVEVKGREDLIREISIILNHPARAESMGEIAYRVVEEDHGVVERSMELIDRYLDGL